MYINVLPFYTKTISGRSHGCFSKTSKIFLDNFKKGHSKKIVPNKNKNTYIVREKLAKN